MQKRWGRAGSGKGQPARGRKNIKEYERVIYGYTTGSETVRGAGAFYMQGSGGKKYFSGRMHRQRKDHSDPGAVQSAARYKKGTLSDV